MKRRRGLYLVACFVALVIGVVIAQRSVLHVMAAQAKAAVQAPMFEVDPLWPKPLPNNWIIGSAIGVAADAQDHIWVVHRPGAVQDNERAQATTPPMASCCTPAPPVLEFDQAGNLIASWGGPGQGYEWPQSMHGISIDYKGNVWLAANGAKDSEILKFTQAGKFLLQIGHFDKTKGSLDTENVHSAAQMRVDPTANEVYVADGYGNHRVIVYDADNGAFKRMWGAYGNKPEDTDYGRYNPAVPPIKQFRNPVHCVMISTDGNVYVCDRVNDRIQVFKKDGTFVKEAFVAKNTLGSGSTWEIEFSKDPAQKYIYMTDGMNQKVYTLLRDTLEVITSFGTGGRMPGAFYGVHSIASDSKGNLYTTETWTSQRVQRFIYKGIGPARNTARPSGN